MFPRLFPSSPEGTHAEEMKGSKKMNLFRLREVIPHRGFTLIELLIVIAIILILIAIALPNFLEAQIRAKVAKVKGDLRSVGVAMDSYFLDFKIYPPDHDPDSLTSAHGLYQLSTPIKYIAKVPFDIFNTKGSGIALNEPFFEMASTGYPAYQARLRRPKVNAFVVFSHGPDVSDNFDSNDSWPYGSVVPCPRDMGYLNYNPTNGTVSRGDLNQPGGEYRSGSYCVDHWNHVRGFYPPPNQR